MEVCCSSKSHGQLGHHGNRVVQHRQKVHCNIKVLLLAVLLAIGAPVMLPECTFPSLVSVRQQADSELSLTGTEQRLQQTFVHRKWHPWCQTDAVTFTVVNFLATAMKRYYNTHTHAVCIHQQQK